MPRMLSPPFMGRWARGATDVKHRLYLDDVPHDIWLAPSRDGYVLHWEGTAHDLAAETGAVVVLERDTVHVHLDGRNHVVRYEDALSRYAGADAEGSAVVRAPMPGVVIAVRVSAGDAVIAGQPLIVIESMKLETVIRAPIDAVVEALNFSIGQTFARDAVLVSLAAGEP
jgi:acetyl/propionyl-CoA carboxylase alpha subunit